MSEPSALSFKRLAQNNAGQIYALNLVQVKLPRDITLSFLFIKWET